MNKIILVLLLVTTFSFSITRAQDIVVEYWAGKFGVRPNFLREIMKTTGNELTTLQKYFNKQTDARIT